MIVWSLFDSGNGSYSNVSKNFKDITNYSIGIDRENKNKHFININLADYSRLYGDNKLWDELDKLPLPDLIIASPPCESWSVASAMPNGNACWKQEKSNGVFKNTKPLSRFTIRNNSEYNNRQYNAKKSLMTRINGELCIFNTIEIINKYKPSVYIIENPAYGRIWDYIETILGFNIPYENLTFYNNYNYPIKKPTKFKSNIDLNLKKDKIPNQVDFRYGFSRNYNDRSNIPGELVEKIFNEVLKYLKEIKVK